MWLIRKVVNDVPKEKNPEKRDSLRKAQNKYFQANFKTVGCKLTKEMAERFDAKVKQEKKTINAVLLEMIKNYLGEWLGWYKNAPLITVKVQFKVQIWHYEIWRLTG